MSALTIKHWEALEQILQYLKSVVELGILFSNHGHTHIECFVDANWAVSKLIKDPLQVIVFSLVGT